MLTVRDEQFEAFERWLFQDMQRRVERAIATAFPELSAEAAEQAGRGNGEAESKVSAIVEHGIESAARFNISDGPDVAAFIALGLALRFAAPGEAGKWIHNYLNRLGASGPTKLRMIESQLRARASDDKALGVIAQRLAQARERAVE